MPGILLAGPGLGFAVGNTLYDLAWELQGALLEATAEAGMNLPVSGGGRNALINAMQGVSPFSVLTGGVVSVVRDAASGVRCFQITSGVGQRTTRNQMSVLAVPLGSQAGIGGVVPAWRANRRYTAGIVCRWPVRGPAVIEIGAVNSNGFLTFLGAGAGFILSSDPGVNGGAWTPRVRLVDAGGITTFASTGLTVPVASQQKFEIRYTEGLVPLLEILINGATVAQASGLANLPVAPATNPSFHFGVGCSAVAGTTLEYSATTYKVEEI